MTTAIRPSWRRRDALFLMLSWGAREEEYFLVRDWTEVFALKLLVKLDLWRTRGTEPKFFAAVFTSGRSCPRGRRSVLPSSHRHPGSYR
ncbi:hypothetical protein XH93_41145 [Bradyrhizobium sp. CCBAU 51753]|nr:hypothetical protein XH93_41145 [Bradyrhizobium sp. CCBAU 51753]